MPPLFDKWNFFNKFDMLTFPLSDMDITRELKPIVYHFSYENNCNRVKQSIINDNFCVISRTFALIACQICGKSFDFIKAGRLGSPFKPLVRLSMSLIALLNCEIETLVLNFDPCFIVPM